MNSPLLTLPTLNNENHAKSGGDQNKTAERTHNGTSNANHDDGDHSNRPSGGIPGPLKSPLAAFHPYASGYNMNQAALAAQAAL